MRRVIIESPYAGSSSLEVTRHEDYARAALLDCLDRDEAPLASHLLYTQVLDDNDPEERYMGIRAGLVWHGVADAVVVYCDLGISKGMRQGIHHAESCGLVVERRYLKGWP